EGQLWATLKAKCAQPAHQAPYPLTKKWDVPVHVDQSLVVRDPAMRFHREAELRRYGCRPLHQGILAGVAVEGVVEFNGGKHLSVESQHLTGGQIGWVEGPFPLGIAEAGRSDVGAGHHNLHD